MSVRKNNKTKAIPQELLEAALKSGNYKTKTIWTELYLRFRQDNLYLYVKKEIPDQIIEETVEILKNIEFLVWDFNVKKALGAYLLSQICVKPTNNFFVKNPYPDIRYKKI